MRIKTIFLAGALGLSACADPLADFERISALDVVDADNGPALASSDIDRSSANPDDLIRPSLHPERRTTTAQLAPRKGLLALLQPAGEQKPQIEADGATSTEVAALDTGAQESSADKAPGPARKGLLSWLLVPETQAHTAVEPSHRDELTNDQSKNDLAQLRPRARPDRTSKEVTRLASIDPGLPQPGATSKSSGTQPGFMARLLGLPDAIPRLEKDEDQTGASGGVPFGTVMRACGVTGKALGQRVERAGGGRGYALYDTATESTEPRSFYITGFDDGCARRITAALAMFGHPSMHEQLRYGRPADLHPYSTTDKAYEDVKFRICGAAAEEPCGARMKRLEQHTVFVTAYEAFTENARWSDLLLSNGTLVAAALKAP